MADKDIRIGQVINFTGMLGVFSAVVLFVFGLVMLVFQRGLGLDIASLFHWLW